MTFGGVVFWNYGGWRGEWRVEVVIGARIKVLLEGGWVSIVIGVGVGVGVGLGLRSYLKGVG